MRLVCLFIAVILCACAAPQSQQYFFKGVYTPGEAAIDADGAFVTRASVFEVAQMPVAQQAAMFRLKQAATGRGYDFFVPDDARISDGSGNQFLMTGRLYREKDAPGNAMPIDMLDISRPVSGQQRAAEPPTAVRADDGASGGESGPKVIRAPDFLG